LSIWQSGNLANYQFYLQILKFKKKGKHMMIFEENYG